MLRGLYASSSALQALEQAQTLVSDNVSNSTTPGYLNEAPVFAEYLPLTLSERPSGNTVGVYALGTDSMKLTVSTTPGSVQVTGQPLDIAPAPDTWIAVKAPGRTLYTQDGQLEVNAAGELTTGSGYLVESAKGGPIKVGNAAGVSIADNGLVSQDQVAVGQIKLVTANSNENLQPSLTGLSTPSAKAVMTTGGTVTPGALRESDVSLSQEAGAMVSIAATYQADSEMEHTGVQTFSTLLQTGMEP